MTERKRPITEEESQVDERSHLQGDALPELTIVMPSFNQEPYLEEAIRSVVAQGYPKLELIVIDGGSTDGSVDIIKRHSTELAYWHSRPDLGQTDALVQGFSRATGRLMGWVNSDDVLLPGALHAVAYAYQRHPEVGLIGGNYVLIDPYSKILRCKRHPANPARFIKYGLVAVNQPGSFFSRDAYNAVSGLHLDLDYVMDTDLYLRMLDHGVQYQHVDSWLAGFRIHEVAKTVAQWDRTLAEYERAVRTHWSGIVATSRRPPLAYRLYQIMNGNYLRMTVSSLRARGQHWRDWSSRLDQAGTARRPVQ